MSLKALSEYTFVSRYSQFSEIKNRKETWDEAVTRVFQMHRKKYAEQIAQSKELADAIDFAEKMQKKKRVLAAQRSLQFAGDALFKHELKMFNCLSTHIDRVRVFQEIMYSLLCGCGVGFSVQKQHATNLPTISKRNKGEKKFVIEDSIEGWADAIGVLMASYFDDEEGEWCVYKGYEVDFDYSLIRPEGALIAGQFKAPGPDGLRRSIIKIINLIEARLAEYGDHSKLKPIDCYDIIMHVSDAVLSGGVRRSATLCMFSFDDEEMMQAKTGDWFQTNPQRARSNNSAALLKGQVTKEQFSKLMHSTKNFGEPAFIWVPDLDITYNPCVEIGMLPKTKDGRSGFQGCNLTEINGKWCDSEDNFLKACEAAAIIGTMQAGYTNFKYLTPSSKEIFDEEALLGCSITGMMDNPEILFNEEIQKKGAQKILEVNEKIAKLIGIKPAARATCVKPAGSTSCILGTASGIHPHHAKRYIRRVQANKTEQCLQIFENKNPLAVEKSVWSANDTDKVISFLCEVPKGAIVKNQLKATDLLEKVKLTQNCWVEFGTRVERCHRPTLRHNVSNTINVRSDEWDDVENFIFDNQEWFAGVSLLPASGDLDYAQAPFSTVLTPQEIVSEYGDASMFASGLIVDGLAAFDNNLWKACDTVLGYGEKFNNPPEQPDFPVKPNVKQLKDYWTKMKIFNAWLDRAEWCRRVNQFGARYFGGDVKRATYCLKHVSLWKTWCDLKREYVEIEWDNENLGSKTYINADTLGAQACSGGQCELV